MWQIVSSKLKSDVVSGGFKLNQWKLANSISVKKESSIFVMYMALLKN